MPGQDNSLVGFAANLTQEQFAAALAKSKGSQLSNLLGTARLAQKEADIQDPGPRPAAALYARR